MTYGRRLASVVLWELELAVFHALSGDLFLLNTVCCLFAFVCDRIRNKPNRRKRNGVRSSEPKMLTRLIRKRMVSSHI